MKKVKKLIINAMPAVFLAIVAATMISIALSTDKLDKDTYDHKWFKKQESRILHCIKIEQMAKVEYESYVNSLPENREEWSESDIQEEIRVIDDYYKARKLTDEAMREYLIIIKAYENRR